MGLSVVEEARCPRSGYSIDMLAREPSPSADAHRESAARPTAGWAVEFDGPSHFLASKLPTGATLLKRHHLQLLGYSLVSVPYWEWDEVRGDTASEEAYLRSKISASFVHEDPRRPRESLGGQDGLGHLYSGGGSNSCEPL